MTPAAMVEFIQISAGVLPAALDSWRMKEIRAQEPLSH